jgi:hypothetical protein
METLKQLHLKAAELCEKYEKSLEYEKCDYHLVETFDSGGYGYGQNRRLMLIDISTKKILTDGGLKRIKSYMNLRKIDAANVYDWNNLVKEENN